MLTSLSPLDGRYQEKTKSLKPYFSEAALIRYRLLVEVEWLIFLCNEVKLKHTRLITKIEQKKLRSFYKNFVLLTAEQVKEIENQTNHDVKAIEYYLRQQLKTFSLKDLLEFIHFACTSEDINNLAYALLLKDALGQIILPEVLALIADLKLLARKYKSVAMVARTHGQAATPTTMGKELINFVARLERQINIPCGLDFLGKINGAVGNYNAHLVAYPEVNWLEASEKFIKRLGLTPNLYTTQIEPHDWNAELFDCFRRLNTILIDFCGDMWTYISLDYFKQKLKAGEVGSSTMPHKVNPIDFENAEGNLGIANALFSHFSQKLPISRLQRDLSDSTVFRNLGSAFAYSYLAYQSLRRGLKKLEMNQAKIENDLDSHWEILAEAIQTVLRQHKITDGYEQLKRLTRGKKIKRSHIKTFIKRLKIGAGEKKKLSGLTPQKYFGLAENLVTQYLKLV